MATNTDKNLLDVDIEIFTRGDPWDSLADPIDTAAHTVLMTNATLQALIIDIRRISEAFEGQEADRTAGTLTVRYRTGELLTYSLTCYSPREGMRVCFNGDRGRIEYHEFIGTHMNRAVRPGDFKLDAKPGSEPEGEWIKVYPHFQTGYTVPMPAQTGPHGGADAILNEHIYSPTVAPDTLGRTAGHEQGAASILVGIAGVQSIATNLPVNLLDLVPLRPEATRLSELV